MTSRTSTLWTFAITSLALFMVSLDNLVVTTAIPVIRADLGASLEQLEWTVNAYTLTFAVLLLTGAALGDRANARGKRRASARTAAGAAAGAAASRRQRHELGRAVGSLARSQHRAAAGGGLPLRELLESFAARFDEQLEEPERVAEPGARRRVLPLGGVPARLAEAEEGDQRLGDLGAARSRQGEAGGEGRQRLFDQLAQGGAAHRPLGERLHVVAPGGANHPGNAILTAMRAAGYTGNSFGEVSGIIPDLLT